MYRDAALFKASDGWGFEVFAKGKKDARRLKTAADVAACVSCHQARPNRVLTEYSK
jgi:cytochrome c553